MTLSWNPNNFWTHGSFKRVPEGWIFRAPSPWLLGPCRHYLVSDAQRAAIVAFIERDQTGRDIAAQLVAILISLYVCFLVSSMLSSTALGIVAFWLVGAFLYGWSRWWKFQPL